MTGLKPGFGTQRLVSLETFALHDPGVDWPDGAHQYPEQAVMATLDFEREHPLCPAGCGCHLWTEDADRADCGCDGPCSWFSWDDYLADVLERPDYYREIWAASRERKLAVAPSGVGGTDG